MDTRMVRAIALAGAIGLALGIGPGLGGPQRTLRERQVFVTVLDRNGKPAQGLGVGDFSVREGDIAREVLRVEPATGPMQIALLADTSQATGSLTLDLRKGLASFAKAILAKNPDSQLALMTFGERPTKETGYTNNVATLDRSIQRIFARPGGGAYLLEAILDAVKDLKKLPTTRPIIVAFLSEAGPEFSTVSHQQIADALKEGGIELWAIVLQTSAVRGPDSEEGRNRSIVLGDVTTNSGGARVAILTRTALESQYLELAERLASQYVVTYSRPESLVPPDRLEVTVTREGLHLMAPRWTGK